MRRLALLLLLLSACSLAGCGTAEVEESAATPTALEAYASAPPATASLTVTPQPSHTPTPTPVPGHRTGLSPSATPTPTPTFTPTPVPGYKTGLPPLQPPAAGEPLALSLGWQFNANGHLTAGLRANLGDQHVFLLSSLGRTVYALTTGGEVLWQTHTSGPVYALALLAGGRVAVGDDAGYVTLLDGRGRRIWRHDLGSRVTALYGGWQGGLLAGGWDERLTFLDEAGKVRWQASLRGAVSSIAVLPDLALAATLDAAHSQLQAFDPAGVEAWHYDAAAPITNLGIVEAGQAGDRPAAYILAGLQDGRLLALDSTGELRWQQALAAAPAGAGGPVWHVANLAGQAAPEIVAGLGGGAPLLALLSAEGEVMWRISLPSPVAAITTLDLDGDGLVEILAGLASGEVQAYDGQGRYRASVHAGLSVWGLEAADQGTALVLADVVAWQIAGLAGPGGAAWLPPPAMLPDPAGWPLAMPPGTERAEGEAILAFLGDVSPGRTVEAQLARYGPAYPWQGLAPLLHEADLAVANLEGVLTTQGRPLDKPYLLRAHPQWGQMLIEGGLDLVTLANNHALDYGQEGLDETLDTLHALHIATVGAGRSPEEARRPALHLVAHNGVRIAILAYAAARWNGSVDVPATDRLAWAEPAAVQADVRAVRDQADVVVVLFHFGTEYAAKPSASQMAVARAAIDAGADLVVGHHPHVTQTVERYRRGLIVYSLGDALFDIPRRAAMQGDLLRVHVTTGGLVQAELWPFWIEDAIRPRLLDDGQGGPQVRIVYP